MAKYKRAPKYDPEDMEIAKDHIIENMNRGKSLSSIMRADVDMILPSASKVYDWLNPKLKYHDADFAERYARATSTRSEVLFDEILEIADDASKDYKIDDQGKKKFDVEHWQRAKLRIDTRKWHLAKVMPTKYGERSTTVIETDALIPIMTTRAEKNEV